MDKEFMTSREQNQKTERGQEIEGKKSSNRKDLMMKYESGYLTVFTALTMTVLLSLFLTLLEGVRSNGVRMEAEIAADIGMDSILAEYHRELLTQYNMFWIDTSYGTGNPSVEALGNHLFRYLEKNCILDEGLAGEIWYRDLLGMTVGAAEISAVSVAADNGGRAFRERAAEAIRDDIGITLLKQVKSWLDTVESNGLVSRDVEQEKEAVDESIQEYDGMDKQISESKWVTIEVENPTQALEQQRAAGILNLVLEHPREVSGKGVDTSGLLTGRMGQGLINVGNWQPKEEREDLGARLLFQEYVLRYSGHYGAEKENSLLSYQTEYVIAGKSNDTDNLKSIAYRISALREAANAFYLFSDEVKCAEASAVAAAAASAMLVPEIAPLLKMTILLGWAYAESLYDVKTLLAGGKVPLLKNADTWHYDINCVFQGVGEETPIESGEGLEYTDYLRILLALTDLDEQTLRFMDVVEMDIRQTPGNASFRMDGCVDRVEADILVNSAYGYSFQIIRRKGY